MIQSLTLLPHVQFRRSRTFYLEYDLSWLIVLSLAVVALHVVGFQGIAPTWKWYFPLLFPLVAYVDILCQVAIHNACHINFPRPINRAVGELLGLIVLARFASWEIIHARHHKYSDDVDRDPHPLYANYWTYLFRSLYGVERQLQRMYVEQHGDTEDNRRRERIRAFISFGTNIVLVAAWWKVLGNTGFFFFFLPASVIGWLFVMHFNWVTHNALARDGVFKPVNIDRGVYWLGNRLLFGIYMHANHHRNAGIFNPLRMKGQIDERGSIASELTCKTVEPFGPVWFPKGGYGQIKHLGAEVKEYFDQPGLELKPGDVVLDVGANVGAFAMQAARTTPDLHLVCVEPIPVLFDSLRKNFESDPALKAAKGSLFQVGLTREADVGEVEFTYFGRLPCDSTRHMGEKRRQFEQFFAAKGAALRTRFGAFFGGILKRIVAGLPKGRLGRWFSDRATGATRVRCKLVTLDHVLEQAKLDDVALLKIDVEGAELDVLEGISPATWPHVRQIVLEGHDEAGRLDFIRKMLEGHGYTVHTDKPEIAEQRGLNNFLLFARRTT